MQNMSNLQGEFLKSARKECIPVTLFLTNGFQMKGFIKAYDNFTVVLEGDGKQQLVYKHAISTVVPVRPVSYVPDSTKKGDRQVE